MTTDEHGSEDSGTGADQASRHPEQEHPPQEAHGGSMAPGLVDDTGHPVAPSPTDAAGE